MRLGKLETYNSWFGFVLFWVGVFLAWKTFDLVRYNVLTNAAYMVAALGGTVNVVEGNTALPAIELVEGGMIGLGIAESVGWMVFALQLFFWLTQRGSFGSLERPVIVGMTLLLIADVWTVLFYLLGGANILDILAANPLDFWLNRLPVSLFLVLTMFSLGAELWLALAIDILRTQYVVGLGGLWTIARTLGRLLLRGGMALKPEAEEARAEHGRMPAPVMLPSRGAPPPPAPKVKQPGGFKPIQVDDVDSYFT